MGGPQVPGDELCECRRLRRLTGSDEVLQRVGRLWHRLREEFLLDLGANEREEYYLEQYSKAQTGRRPLANPLNLFRSCGKTSETPDTMLLEMEALRAEQGQAVVLEEAQAVDLPPGK